jgi:LysR substrate binding domain
LLHSGGIGGHRLSSAGPAHQAFPRFGRPRRPGAGQGVTIGVAGTGPAGSLPSGGGRKGRGRHGQREVACGNPDVVEHPGADVGGEGPGEEQGQPDDWLTAIANGHGVALAPESAARCYARPGITYRPVTGVSPSQAGVAWPPGADTSPVIADFVRCCLDTIRAA